MKLLTASRDMLRWISPTTEEIRASIAANIAAGYRYTRQGIIPGPDFVVMDWMELFPGGSHEKESK